MSIWVITYLKPALGLYPLGKPVSQQQEDVNLLTMSAHILVHI
jgi:hypothetical protein